MTKMCDKRKVKATWQLKPCAKHILTAAPIQQITTLRGGAENKLHKHGAAIKKAASTVDIRMLQFEFQSALSVSMHQNGMARRHFANGFLLAVVNCPMIIFTPSKQPCVTLCQHQTDNWPITTQFYGKSWFI